MPNWSEIQTAITNATGERLGDCRACSIGGGSINAAYLLECNTHKYFIKLNKAALLKMFEAESEGLRALTETCSLRIPAPICHGISGAESYLVMEYIALGGRGTGARLGEQLAALHSHTQARFGWYRDNTIGATAQPNCEMDSWVDFWCQQRLGFQLKLAAQNGAGSRLIDSGEELLETVGVFFGNYLPAASLLHGDLWSGNYGHDDAGQPVIYDPAVYYGDREADIAMTELFGSFPAAFYGAYNASWPLEAGYSTRKTLYNLYHILNHYNLFGGGYASQAESMIANLLSETR